MKTEGSMDWSALEDTELALALKRGEDAAFAEIVRRHQGRVYAVAFRYTANREDALDVAQEALLKVYRKIDAWQPTGNFLPWLLRVTSNLAIDFLRRRKRRRHERLDESYVPMTEGAAVEPASMNTEQAVRAHEIDVRIREALPRLSERQRVVFMLRHYEGLQLADIAAELGCTVGSVKVHLFRSLRKLQKELGDLR
ncbi:MAG: sigma-70 family RNA polymerase sigma factor [Nitrospiraceae bacterium]|nr:sigma-70 family RNA polymerase sigma factor [Nitrospiraceae bacterium]